MSRPSLEAATIIEETVARAAVSTNRAFVLVSEVLYWHYRTRWREIDRDWLGGAGSLEVFSAAFTGIRAAREELRAEVRALAKDFPGRYLVPV